MSSVNSSGSNRSSNDDQVRSLREEYKKREAELIKKHNQEIRTLSESNVEQIDEIKGKNLERINNLKGQSQQSITRRDAKYQREINDMKKLHTKQLERLLKENETKLQQQRQASTSEVKDANLGKNDRVNELHTKYSEAINQKNEDYNQLVEQMREEQSESYGDLKENLQKRHQEERDQLRSNYQEQIVKLENDLRTTRNSSTERIRGQEIRHMNDKVRMEDNFMSEIQSRESGHADIQESLMDGYKDNLAELKQKNLEANEKRASLYQGQHSNFKDEVNERLNTRERRLERKLADEQNRNIRTETKIKRSANEEVNAWRDQYQQKFEVLEDEKKQIQAQAKQDNSEDINRAYEKSSKAIASSNRYMRNVLDVEQLKSKQAISALESELETRTEQQKSQADNRVTNIREDSFQAEERLKKTYEQNLELMKKEHAQEIRDLRLQTTIERDKALQSIRAQVGQDTVEKEQKMQETIQKYEKRIADLTDQFTREKRLRDNREKQLIESLSKGKEAEKEALVMKYAKKNQQTEQQHQKELQEISRRHNEQVNNIMSSVKKT